MTRESAFSRAASEKLAKRRAGLAASADVDVNAKAMSSRPNTRASTSAAAAPSALCVDG